MTKRHCSRREVGMSLIELLVVMAVIGIIAAVGFPAIGSYYKNYQIRGASRDVASEIAAARLKAIARNVNQGVTFQIVDNDSYRFIIEDETPDFMGNLRDLPGGVRFLATGGTDGGFRFNRLGMICRPGSSPSCPALPAGCTAAEATDRGCGSTAGNYVIWDNANSRYRITLVHVQTGVTWNVDVAFGGRVFVQ